MGAFFYITKVGFVRLYVLEFFTIKLCQLYSLRKKMKKVKRTESSLFMLSLKRETESSPCSKDHLCSPNMRLKFKHRAIVLHN